jgi:UDP-N-acetylmuramoyl-tripeptide--D-alanyl-D-alanine ligase
LENSLKLLSQITAKGHRIAVLGDMRELGELTEDKHKQAAVWISQNSDFVVLVGPNMEKYTYPELLKLKFKNENIKLFKTSETVGDFMKTKIKKGDLILVKGSQNTIYLEQVVKDLMVKSEDADRLLCRQSPYWEKVRQDFFKNNPS